MEFSESGCKLLFSKVCVSTLRRPLRLPSRDIVQLTCEHRLAILHGFNNDCLSLSNKYRPSNFSQGSEHTTFSSTTIIISVFLFDCWISEINSNSVRVNCISFNFQIPKNAKHSFLSRIFSLKGVNTLSHSQHLYLPWCPPSNWQV